MVLQCARHDVSRGRVLKNGQNRLRFLCSPSLLVPRFAVVGVDVTAFSLSRRASNSFSLVSAQLFILLIRPHPPTRAAATRSSW